MNFTFESLINISQKCGIFTGLRYKFEQVLKELSSSSIEKSRILELGAGNISYKKYFPNAEFICSDIVGNNNVDMIIDVHRIPFDDNHFDIILMGGLIEHLENPFKAFEEVYQVLKEGGKLLLSSTFAFPIHSYPSDYFRPTKAGLYVLLKKFKLLKFAQVNLLFWNRIPLGYVVLAQKPKIQVLK